MTTTTQKAARTRQRLLSAALALFAEKGYDATTLRDIAGRADTSLGLAYRYFPSKPAFVLALYDDRVAAFLEAVSPLPAGSVGARFSAALGASLAVLAPHRDVLGSLLGTLSPSSGLPFLPHLPSQQQVREVVHLAACGAADAPADARALGDLLYLVVLGILLFWLVDRSPGQSSTSELVRWVEDTTPVVVGAWRFPPTRAPLLRVVAIARRALLDAPHPSTSEVSS